MFYFTNCYWQSCKLLGLLSNLGKSYLAASIIIYCISVLCKGEGVVLYSWTLLEFMTHIFQSKWSFKWLLYCNELHHCTTNKSYATQWFRDEYGQEFYSEEHLFLQAVSSMLFHLEPLDFVGTRQIRFMKTSSDMQAEDTQLDIPNRQAVWSTAAGLCRANTGIQISSILRDSHQNKKQMWEVFISIHARLLTYTSDRREIMF